MTDVRAAQRTIDPAVLLAVVVLLVFANVFRGGFVLDDHVLIERNEKAHTLAALGTAFTSDVQRFQAGASAPSAYYRPLTLASFVFDVALWGTRPGPMHLINVLAHLVATLLAYALMRRLFVSPWVAAAVTTVWALHPIVSESVAWISGRPDPLAACGILGAMLAFIRYRESGRNVWLAAAIMCIGAGCLAKETALLAPPMALTAGRLARHPRPRARGRGLLDVGLLCLPVLACVIARWTVMGTFAATQFTSGGREAALRIALRGVWFYVRSWLWPAALVGDIHVRAPAWSDPGVCAGAAITVAVLAALATAWLRRSRAAVPLTLLALSAVTVSGVLVALPIPIAVRYLYVPSLWMVAACLLPLGRLPAGRAALALLPAVLALAITTVARNREYRDDRTLYTAIVDHAARAGSGVDPGYYTLVNFARLLADDGRIEDAEHRIRQAIDEEPGVSVGWNHLGNIRSLRGDSDGALAAWARAAALDPGSIDPPLNSAQTLDQAGRHEEALRAYRIALDHGLGPPRRAEVEARVRELERGD